MNCFIKNVNSLRDPAIEGKWIDSAALPLSIITLDGWREPLTAVEASFFAGFLFELVPDQRALCVCRIADAECDAYREEMGHRFCTIEFPVKSRSRRYATSEFAHVLRDGSPSVLAGILRKFWSTSTAGHWLFWDCVAGGERDSVIEGAFLTHGRSPVRLHYSLLASASFACITCDDTILDCLVRPQVDRMDRVMSRLSSEREIQILDKC